MSSCSGYWALETSTRLCCRGAGGSALCPEQASAKWGTLEAAAPPELPSSGNKPCLAALLPSMVLSQHLCNNSRFIGAFRSVLCMAGGRGKGAPGGCGTGGWGHQGGLPWSQSPKCPDAGALGADARLIFFFLLCTQATGQAASVINVLLQS